MALDQPVEADWFAPLPQTCPVAQRSGSLETRALVLAPVEEEPLLQETSLVLGHYPPRWPTHVSVAHLQEVDWESLEKSPCLLALVEEESLQSSSPWAHPVEMGQLQAHWHPQVSPSHPVAQLPRPLAQSSSILAFVEEESLLPGQPVVLGTSP
jgi:hypothetical protein